MSPAKKTTTPPSEAVKQVTNLAAALNAPRITEAAARRRENTSVTNEM